MTTIAQFRTKHGDVWYGSVESEAPDQAPRHASLEQYAGTFEYDHESEHGPVYREV